MSTSAPRTPNVLLGEMLECVTLIQQYINGYTQERFQTEQEKQDAVIRRLEILGEAASQLPSDWKARHPTVPWRLITDMRNRVIHGYFSLDLNVIWQTITTDVPTLDPLLRQVIAEEGSEPGA